MTDIQYKTTKTASATVAPYIDVPAYTVTKYTQGFEAGADSWTGSSVSVTALEAHAGTKSLLVGFNDDLSTWDGIAYRTVTGLTVGWSYTFEAWVKITTTVGSRTVGLGVTGKTFPTPITAPTVWTKLSYTFTATATSHQLQLRGPFVGGFSTGYWDDIKLIETVPDHYSTTISFPITGGVFEMDSGWSPYARASIEMPAIDPSLLTMLDPKNNVRVQLNLKKEDPTKIIYFPVARTNLCINPSVELDAGGWGTSYAGGAATGARSTAQAYVGAASYLLAANGTTATTLMGVASPNVAAVTGDVFTASYYVRPDVTRNWNLVPYYYTVGGAYVSTGSVAATVSATAGAWTRVTATFTVPAGATIANMTVMARVQATLGFSEQAYVDAFLIEKSATLGAYFDGATAANSTNSYAWTGSVHASTSTQTPVPIHDTSTDIVRTADMQLRKREIDHKAGTMRLNLYSDEVLLQRLMNKTTAIDTSATAYQSSVRAICNWALGKIGTSLEPTPSVDKSFYVLENSTNLVTNPSFETGTTGWTVGSGTGTLAQSNVLGSVSGTTAMRWQPNITGLSYVNSPNIAVTAGKTYTVTLWMKSSVARSMRLMLRWWTSAPVQIGADINTTAITDSSSTWTKYTWTGVAPATAALLNIYPHAVAGATTDLHYIDAVSCYDSTASTPGIDYTTYFDGSTSATSDYGYAWTGTAQASTSTRTALVSRSPDLLRWEPGEDIWALLKSILDVAGLRLFCDEQRKWRLVDASYSVPGRVTIATGFNAVEGSDTIDLDARSDEGIPIWYDFVNLTYKWKDSAGVDQIAYDVAGTGNNGLTQTIERPFPGAGAAAYILSRASGRGRVQDVTGLVDYSVTPSQEVAITLPMTIAQSGVVSGVSMDLTEDLMTIQSKGLIDTPSDSWYFIPDTLKWSDVPDATTWTNYA